MSRENLEKAFLDISDELLHVSDDLNYSQAIIDGTWPSADDIIAHRRNKQINEIRK